MSFYSGEELKSLGLGRFGEDVRLSRKASFYNPGRISIGSHVRIDDFCVLSAGEGGIEIGDYVHIAVFCSLIGAAKIKMADFSGLSSRVTLYSSNDDYTGEFLTNPTIPGRFRGVASQDVFLEKHVIVGAGSVILPGVTLEEGVSIGALSLVNKSCASFGVYFGSPARRIGERKRHLLELEHQLRQEMLRGQSKVK